MNIQADTKVLTLSGKPYQQSDGTDLGVGQVIAEALAVEKTGGKFKLFTLAQKFFGDATVEIDAADLALVKSAVEKCETYNNIIIGQVLGILENVR